MIQKTLFGKATARVARAAVTETTSLAVSVQQSVVERDPRNKQRRKPSPTQLANFNNKETLRKLTNPVTAKALGPISHVIPLHDSKKKASKWFLLCRKLEKEALKESLGLDGRLVRPQEVLSPSSHEFEDHREKRKRAPTSRIISELKGVPERGRIIRDESGRDKQALERKKGKLAEAILNELVHEVAVGGFPTFDADIEVGRAQIAEVVMSSDLKRAVVFFDPPGLAPDMAKATKEWQERFEIARKHLKNVLASKIRTRFVPDLQFKPMSALDRSKQEKSKDGQRGRNDEVRVLTGNYDTLREEEDMPPVEHSLAPAAPTAYRKIRSPRRNTEMENEVHSDELKGNQNEIPMSRNKNNSPRREESMSDTQEDDSEEDARPIRGGLKVAKRGEAGNENARASSKSDDHNPKSVALKQTRRRAETEIASIIPKSSEREGEVESAISVTGRRRRRRSV